MAISPQARRSDSEAKNSEIVAPPIPTPLSTESTDVVTATESVESAVVSSSEDLEAASTKILYALDALTEKIDETNQLLFDILEKL